ncbi:hypothetical protein SBV1_1860036 [Verrucomicrobia bacterium]|nr:hypothetical protein SBV1_1860036 [Verrucomicrobiota bacterium]
MGSGWAARSGVLGFRKRQQAAYLYPKKRLLAPEIERRASSPRPSPPEEERSRLGYQSAQRLGGAFGLGWFSKAAASCAHSIRFARYGPEGEGGSGAEFAP